MIVLVLPPTTELGGWKWKFLSQNPPPQLLAAELEKNTAFALVLAQSLPRVEASAVEAVAVGGGNTRVRVTYTNTGFLPTYGAKQALTAHAVKPTALVTLELPAADSQAAADATAVVLVSGPGLRVEIPHLEGRARSEVGASAFHPFMANGIAGGTGWWLGNANEVRLEWVVQGVAGAELKVLADFERGGQLTTLVTLPPPVVVAAL